MRRWQLEPISPRGWIADGRPIANNSGSAGKNSPKRRCTNYGWRPGEKRQLTALGDLRDTHVQRLFVEQKTGSYPELLLLRSWLKRRERRLVESAAERVNRFKTGKLEKWISAITADLTADVGGAKKQSRFGSIVLRATVKAFAEAVERRRAIDLAEPSTIHKTRVAFKRFRYMMESLSPDITGLSKRQLRALGY
ncbi:MAG: CHAD domain-containing protein, partial [Verrucomicrobia bacterium]|nr:CHAD domain-containing protein [Verrucomicrobiota bacterium]